MAQAIMRERKLAAPGHLVCAAEDGIDPFAGGLPAQERGHVTIPCAALRHPTAYGFHEIERLKLVGDEPGYY